LEIQKNIDVYKSRQEQIKIIEKRIVLPKPTTKHKKKHLHRIENDADSDIRRYKPYKAKKEFQLVLNVEINKVEEASEAQKKFKRDDGDDIEDEEEVMIIEHRLDPLIVINTPIQDNLAPVETQLILKHRRILHDDN
jgi:hypothetical protein